ncbi:MAG: 23S rRNA (uracil(1939)-C(5))-methyltransferase RlmD [Candidatus Omnitrophica bacterium]|nr:23S rRNA (uracil(1939)-C(5))-methyltransferase RlmD [Candidatus Omnitrophota bacterium]
MEVKIEKIIYPGKSLCRDNGRVIILDEGLPGETAQINIISNKKNYSIGRIEKIVQASPQRTIPRCAHYKVCSPYQYIEYPVQVKIKIDQIKELITHTLKIDLPNLTIRPSENIWGYRNKLHLHILHEKDNYYYAYHLPGDSQKFTHVDNCFLASEQSNRLIDAFLKLIKESKTDFIDEITIRENQTSTQMLLICYGSQKQKPQALCRMVKQFPLSGIVYIHKAARRRELIWGTGEIVEHLNGKTFYYGGESFFQINIPALKLLLADLRISIPFEQVKVLADLYCGVGIFGIMFSKIVEEIMLVESSKENIFFLKKNLKSNHVNNATIFQGKTNSLISEILKKNPGALIIDPPRKGLEAQSLEKIIKSPPDFIIYISCDPATLIRDLKTLLKSYSLQNLFLYDFFAHTPHTETMAILRAK